MRSWNRKIEVNNESGLIKVNDEMKRLTLAIISEAGFSQQFDLSDNWNEILPPGHKLSFQQCFEIFSQYIPLFVALPSFIWKLPFKKLNKIGQGFEEFDKYVTEIITSNGINQNKSNDILSLLIQANKAGDSVLLEREVFANSAIFLFAGHETSSHTISFALGLLAVNPEEQQKLYTHIKSVVGDEVPSYEHSKKLIYCQWVVKETLRLYPPASIVQRFQKDKGTLGGVPIPAETSISLNIHFIQRHPKYWNNPDQFQPERFDPNKNTPPHPFTYIPFSAGPRNCIGQYFATLEIIIILATIIQNYVIEVPLGVSSTTLLETVSSLTAYPKNGMNLIFRKRR